MKKKVVITGGAGLLGINLAVKFRRDWDITLVTRSKNVNLELVNCIDLDLSDSKSLENLIIKSSPDIIIHTAGVTNVEECEKFYFKAYQANTLVSKMLAEMADQHSFKLVHISTDHFSNSKKKYSTENDISMPVNNYARTKLDAEFEVLKGSESSLVIRTNFYGWGHSFRSSFSDFIINSLEEKKQISLFDDVYYTPICISDLCLAIKISTEKDLKGIYNVVGPDRVNKLEFGIQVAKTFGLDLSLINKSKLSEQNSLCSRPFEMSLSNKKFSDETGFSFKSLEESIKELKLEGEGGLRKEISQAVSLKQSPQIYYGRQFIDDDDINEVIKTLNSNFLTQGPKVQEFEQGVASYVGAKYAVAVSNWTCGLHIACLAAGVKEGDSVITSPLSFAASSNCAVFCGATPAFADIDPKTLNIDPREVERKCEELGNVKAIIPVHFAGHPCDMKELKRIADKYGAILIEDAAHAIGGQYLSGEMIGSGVYSDMIGFSFHPVKNIATGEGSVITTDNEDIYKQLLRLRSHGVTKGDDPFVNQELAYTDGKVNSWYYEMQQIGFNYRITDIQCSLGASQLRKLPHFVKRRIEITAKYDSRLLENSFLNLRQNETREVSGNHLYVIEVDYEKLGKSRSQVYEELKQYGVNAHVHYIPIPLLPFYEKSYRIEERDYSNAIAYYNKAMTLPLYPSMTDAMVDHVIESIHRVLR